MVSLGGFMLIPITPVEAETGFLAPVDAMAIVAMQRQQLHEKILRLRALREALEADQGANIK